jgi:hypothetical protein
VDNALEPIERRRVRARTMDRVDQAIQISLGLIKI